MTRWLTAVLLAGLVLALGLRGWHLAERPMHNDEAVNAIKFRQLWEQGVYKYDPNEHHGPTLLFATLALERLTRGPEFARFTEARLRWVTVVFGLGLVLLLPGLVDALGRRGTAWAAVFTATSPALVFYSGYYIHETLLVAFTFLVLVSGWRYWRQRKLGWLLLAGAGLGLMSATKETFVLTLMAAGIALALNHTWNRLIDASGPPEKAPRLSLWHMAAGAAVWLAVAALFFTSFFTHRAGLADALRTYAPWIHRAEGASPHIYPWPFYLHRLLFFHPGAGPVWTEALILLLALFAGWAGFARRYLGRASASFVRFLALYTFLLTAFYSLLAYKTPWCLLSFWHGAVLLAGVGAAVLMRCLRQPAVRYGAGAALAVGAAHLAWQSWEQNTTYAADQRNPYVYAQTSPDLLELVSQVQRLAAVAPEGQRMVIQVAAADGDYWPLPWYFRAFPQVGWWEAPPPTNAAAWVIAPALASSLNQDQAKPMGIFALRPQVFLELYVRPELWQRWVESHSSAPKP